MLYQVNGANLAKRRVGERQWEAIEIREDIRARVRVAVYADGARVFVDPAADI
jgi:hypothetical protein